MRSGLELEMKQTARYRDSRDTDCAVRVIARRQEAKVSTLQVAYLEEPEEPAALLGLGVVHILLQLRPHKGVASALCNGCCWGEGAFRDDERREGAPQPAAC
jgi:hypothetical protein